MTFAVVLIVSGALVLGAAVGAYAHLPARLEGFMVALAGGALLISAVSELVEPAVRETSIWWAGGLTLVGGTTFSVLDALVDKVWGPDSGGGLLAAITLDGVPENLALGVALIGAGPAAVAALSGSILLSNFPEATGGSRQMIEDGRSARAVLGLWAATGVLLSAAAIAGNLLLRGASPDALALIRSFAAGAVVASLATEVFPEAFGKGDEFAGIATAVGVVLALGLAQLG